MKRRLCMGLISALMAMCLGISAQAGGNGGSDDRSGTPCQSQGTASTSGTTWEITASGQWVLVCAGASAGGLSGTYSQGTNGSGYTADKTPGKPCSVDISWEPVQVMNAPSTVTGATEMTVYPVAFWTGTSGATFPPVAESDLVWASDTQSVPGVNWNAPSTSLPQPPSDKIGAGLANGELVISSLGSDTLWVSLSSSDTTPGKWGADGLCDDPGVVSVVFHRVPDDAPPSRTPGTPGAAAPPNEQQAISQVQADAGQIVSEAPANLVVFAPTCFWISPAPDGPTTIPATVTELTGPPDANGVSIHYLYYLQIAPSATLTWYFGDGASATSDAATSGPGNCAPSGGHVYKQVDGTGPGVVNTCQAPDTTPGVPTGGATVIACQDVDVTAFMGWSDTEGVSHYQCVTAGGGTSGTYATFDQAVAGCTVDYPRALQHGPTTLPVYQIRPVPIA